MGTRAVTNVTDEDGDVYVSLYRQYDGYLQGGHGEELANWLRDAVIGNGIGSSIPPKFFNGVGDLALRLVTYFRQDHNQIGSFYIIPPGTDWAPDYTYTVKVTGPSSVYPEGAVELTVDYYGEKFAGTVEDFIEWMKNQENE